MKIVKTSEHRMAERAFLRIAEPNVADELHHFAKAVGEILSRFNTTNRENRFIVGGAVEVATGCLVAAAGNEIRMAGEGVGGYDFVVSSGTQDLPISVKGSFTKTCMAIGLINKQGDGTRHWKIPTIIVRSGTGLVFAAPDMFPNDALSDKPDQLKLTGAALKAVSNFNGVVIPCDIPFKPDTGLRTGKSASKVIAKEVLSAYPSLSKHLSDIGVG